VVKPLCVDLYAGIGGWAEGFLSEGYDVIGFDIERRPYPGQMVLQDVLTLHGSQFRNAAVIVASPPCQAYSYRAMPWKRAKALPPPDNTLFDACFRIQQEARESAGRYIPLVVENVKGAQPWVGRAKWHYGSYFLWGDVPALMPYSKGAFKKPGASFAQGWNNCQKDADGNYLALAPGQTILSDDDGRKVHHHLNGEVPLGTGKTSWFFGNTKHELRDGIKAADPNYGTRGWFGEHGGTNLMRAQNGYGIKQGGLSGPEWFDKGVARFSSRSAARKEASAQIAKIPFPLAQHIARCFKP
jgi:hypothetical protein